MKNVFKLTLLSLATLLFFQCSGDDDGGSTPPEPTTVTDVDGNVYNTIVIGDQTWMLENLKVTTFNDGTPITEWEFGDDWMNLNNPVAHYQWANTDDLSDVIDFDLPFDYYGAMYNHFAIESGKLAPEGWRIPSQQDFIDLENYLNNNGYSGNVATTLKSNSGWSQSGAEGTDAIGFKGLPNGYVAAGGTATGAEFLCSWVTSDVEDGDLNSSLKRKWVQLFEEPTLSYSDNSITLGAAIRCIKN